MADLGRPAKVAIAFAVVALLTSLIAVVVVMRRSDAPKAAPIAASKGMPTIEATVNANDVTKLKRDVVERATDDKGNIVGIKLKDEAVRTALGLEPDDVITAINGRAIKREFDVYDAVLGMSMMDASIVYIELVRKQQPTLLRWKLDGDLRSARRDPVPRPTPSIGGSTIDPFASRDPLLDTIKKLDELHYEVPRSTVDRVLGNPDQYARQARIVPSIRNGQPEGFRFYAISPSGLWAAIGLRNGDTIRSVNGHDLATPDKLLELYSKVKDATELKLAIVRRGSATEETLVITIK